MNWVKNNLAILFKKSFDCFTDREYIGFSKDYEKNNQSKLEKVKREKVRMEDDKVQKEFGLLVRNFT